MFGLSMAEFAVLPDRTLEWLLLADSFAEVV